MNGRIKRSALALLQACALVVPLVLASASAALAGPPFLTDDPEPIDFGHFEAYMFSAGDNSNGVHAVSGPAVEFNAGLIPNFHFHLVAPYASVTSTGSPRFSGFGDMEFGIKYRFVQETKTSPMVGIFPMAELATGDASKGLGNGRTWYKLPLWIQKSWGPWKTYGGGGVALNSAPGQQNYGFAGWLIQRDLSSKLTLGGELFTQGPTSLGALGTTIANFGGYYNPNPQVSILFSGGHSIRGQSHTVNYFAFYYTFPRVLENNAEGDKAGADKAGADNAGADKAPAQDKKE